MNTLTQALIFAIL